jgi:tetratricopeptide (TPR) repeat protein
MLALLLVPCASGQMICRGSGESVQSARAVANFIVPVATAGCDKVSVKTSDSWVAGLQPVTEIPTRAEVLRRIGVYEAALREPEVAHTSDATVAKAYARLASLYEDAAMYERAEAALRHAIALSRGSAEWSGQLAANLNDLGLLHGEIGKLHEAEKEQVEALRIRESLGGSLEIARSWNSLSGLYFKEHKYAISRDFAQRAMDEFAADKQADVVDKITSRLYLSVAMCYTKDCRSAVPLLKDAIDMAKTTFRPNDFPVGEGKFLLGFAYWKSGDTARASEYMEEGAGIMKEQLGWGHPTYLNALGQYARFLRENRRGDGAALVERQIRQAESVVDVHSIQGRKDADSLAGLR